MITSRPGQPVPLTSFRVGLSRKAFIGKRHDCPRLRSGAFSFSASALSWIMRPKGLSANRGKLSLFTFALYRNVLNLQGWIKAVPFFAGSFA